MDPLSQNSGCSFTGGRANLIANRWCPDYEPLTRWQRFKERWLRIKAKRKPLIYQVGDLVVCSPLNYEKIKGAMP